MAGLIAKLLGGRPAQHPGPQDPQPGVGGYTPGAGPAGQTGFPGSTSATRTFRGRNPRTAKLSETAANTPDMRMATTVQTVQVSPKIPRKAANPRATAVVTLAQTLIVSELQHNSPSEFYGGEPLRTRPGNLTVGGHPLSRAQRAGGHSERDTTTPWTQAQPEISGGVPGSQNVRNTIAQRYKAVPGQVRTYQSSPNPAKPVTTVMVEDRLVWPPGFASESWSVLRRMPYTGRGDGARGAQLNGFRYYATGQDSEFLNAGSGDYGARRLAGRKQPVAFDEPAPWTANNYITTDSVASGSAAQAPSVVTISPQTGRASNTPSYRTGG